MYMSTVVYKNKCKYTRSMVGHGVQGFDSNCKQGQQVLELDGAIGWRGNQSEMVSNGERGMA